MLAPLDRPFGRAVGARPQALVERPAKAVLHIRSSTPLLERLDDAAPIRVGSPNPTIIYQILLLFFIFPAIIHCKNSCPISTCGFKNSDLQIQYPFKLQTDHPPEDCYSFINLRCDNIEGQVVINLPSSGDFYVNSIDYVLRKIALTDPGNCLPGRFMMSNISPYPLEAYLYNTYTYYTCPKERIIPPFTVIPCLSNSINATTVTACPLAVLMEELSGCTPITRSLIPITLSDESNVSVNFSELQLTWTVPRYSDESKSKSNRFLQSSAFIGSAVVLVTFSGLACLLRISNLVAGRDTTANSTIEDAATIESSAATSTTGAPPQATNGTLGTTHEKSQVKIFSEVAFLGESQGTLVSCSICLEEYSDKDRVRILDQCGHYFHVQCIDEWLQKNNSCPVCRTSLS